VVHADQPEAEFRTAAQPVNPATSKKASRGQFL
jgi:hypothetical protein